MSKPDDELAAARAIVKGLPGIKEGELAALGPCAVCKRPLLDLDLPLFYRVTLTRAGFDGDVVRRRLGLVLTIGDVLARVLGPDEDVAKIVDGPVTVVVHEECAGKVGHLLQLFPNADEAVAAGGDHG